MDDVLPAGSVGATVKQIRSSAWLEHYTDNVGVSSSNLDGSTKFSLGGLAQLARASALHAEGHRFDSDILHLTLVLSILVFSNDLQGSHGSDP